MQNFGDPSFKYSVAAAQVLGTLALRLADADILPFDYEAYGEAIQKHLRELQDELKKGDAADQIQFDVIASAATRFTGAAKVLSERIADSSAWGGLDEARRDTVNQALLQGERDFLLEGGLPGRPWFRHALYAPGLYTGYAAVVLPGVREAVDGKDWRMAAQEPQLVAAGIERGTRKLGQAA